MSCRLRALLADEDAQSIVEFALLLPVLMYILMGIIQFGLLFNAYVTMSNAVREAARDASFYVYDGSLSASANDTARHAKLEATLLAARGVLNLGTTAATGTTNFAHTGSFSPACSYSTTTCTTTDGDISLTYTIPSGVTAVESRRGYQMSVEATDHEVVFIPLLGPFLPDDPSHNPYGGSWIRIFGRITVVIN